MLIPRGRSEPRSSHTACNLSKTRMWFRCACWQWLCPFCLPLNAPSWFFYWRSTFFSTCMDLHIDSDGRAGWTVVIRKGMSIKVLTSASHALIFGWGVSSFLEDDCGIFVGMVEALTSVEIILRYTHNARFVWDGLWGLLWRVKFLFVLYMQRKKIHCFCQFFCLLCGLDHVRCSSFYLLMPVNYQDSRSWHTLSLVLCIPIYVLALSKHIYLLTFFYGFLFGYHLSPFKFSSLILSVGNVIYLRTFFRVVH